MRSLEIRESLVKKDPERTDWQRDLGVSLNYVGRIFERTGRRREGSGVLYEKVS